MALCCFYGGEVAIRRSLAPTGISIAVTIRSLDPSLSTQLIVRLIAPTEDAQ